MNKSSIRYALVMIAVIGAFTLLNGQACSPMQALDGTDTSLSAESSFAISPSGIQSAAGSSFQMTATGGTAPYTYQVIGGTATITSTGYFTSGAITGTSSYVTVSATDALGQIATATITIIPGALTVSYYPNPAPIGGAIAMSASGGIAPYTYTLLSGGGVVNGTVYNSPSYSESAQIQVVDSSGLSGLITMSVGSGGSVGSYSYGSAITAISMTPEGAHTVGGYGCSGTTQVGLVTDVGGSWSQYQNIYGDQAFCATYGNPTVGSQVVTDIQVTAEGYHSDNGISCPGGYTQVGDVGDCYGGYCQGNQQVCVQTQSYVTGMVIVRSFTITPENAHNPYASCSTGTSAGITSDCGNGYCYGQQAFCVVKQ